MYSHREPDLARAAQPPDYGRQEPVTAHEPPPQRFDGGFVPSGRLPDRAPPSQDGGLRDSLGAAPAHAAGQRQATPLDGKEFFRRCCAAFGPMFTMAAPCTAPVGTFWKVKDSMHGKDCACALSSCSSCGADEAAYEAEQVWQCRGLSVTSGCTREVPCNTCKLHRNACWLVALRRARAEAGAPVALQQGLVGGHQELRDAPFKRGSWASVRSREEWHLKASWWGAGRGRDWRRSRSRGSWRPSRSSTRGSAAARTRCASHAKSSAPATPTCTPPSKASSTATCPPCDTPDLAPPISTGGPALPPPPPRQ